MRRLVFWRYLQPPVVATPLSEMANAHGETRVRNLAIGSVAAGYLELVGHGYEHAEEAHFVFGAPAR